MTLRPGARLRSAVCDTEAVVVRLPTTGEVISCGGADMLPVDQTRDPTASPQPGADTGSLLGKRYADAESGIEMLCTKAGQGTLAIGGRPLALKEAKPLPSSD